MLKISEAVIVEGKYDKIRLSSLIDTLIIETNGFEIFKDPLKLELIRRTAEVRGIIILMDSDSAGVKIRAYIGGAVTKGKVYHAYIPDIAGKEKRKVTESAEGKLGVEGMSTEVLTEVLTRCKPHGAGKQKEPSKLIEMKTLYRLGLNGGENSVFLRKKLKSCLNLPERLSTKALLQILNTFLSYEDFLQLTEQIKNESR